MDGLKCDKCGGDLEPGVPGDVYCPNEACFNDALTRAMRYFYEPQRVVFAAPGGLQAALAERDRLAADLKDAVEALRNLTDGRLTPSNGDPGVLRDYANTFLARLEARAGVERAEGDRT